MRRSRVGLIPNNMPSALREPSPDFEPGRTVKVALIACSKRPAPKAVGERQISARRVRRISRGEHAAEDVAAHDTPPVGVGYHSSYHAECPYARIASNGVRFDASM
jgi:hypothetical protein